MKHKIIAALIVSFSLLLPTVAFAEVISTPEPYDYNEGLLDVDGLIKSTDMPIALYDNDLFTSVGSPNQFYVDFSQPVDIKALFFKNNYRSARITFYFDDGAEIQQENYSRSESEIYVDVNYSNVIRVDFATNYSPDDLYEFEFFGTYDSSLLSTVEPGEPGDTTPPEEISNVEVTTTEDSATVNFNNPTDIDFDKVNLYLAGQVYSSSNGQIYIEGLNEKTTYTAIVKTVDTLGNESAGVEVQFTTKETPTVPPETPQQVPEVKNLQIETDGERVDLSWNNPPQFFEKATIYRKDLGNVAAGFNLNPFAPLTVSANASFKPLFETNGTTFSDLSIEPETDYEYKVTNTFNGMESQGVVVQASVPKPPLVNTDDVKVPFGASELIKTGNGLLGFVGGFILLALSFVLVPKIIAVIRNANAGTNGSSRAERVGRVQREAIQPRVTDRQMNMATGNAREGRQPRLTKRQMKGV